MRAISFTFRPGVPPEQQHRVLQQIERLQGVHSAARLQPGSTDSDIGRMAYAYVEDDSNPEVAINQIQSLPEVESAEVPPPRRLL